MTEDYVKLLNDMQPDNLKNLKLLLEPYEWLGLGNGSNIEITVINFYIGRAVIAPRYNPQAGKKEVAAIRLYCDPIEKPYGVAWWDVDAKGLIAQLLPMLQTLKGAKKKVRISATGWGGGKRYSVSML